MKSSRTWWSLAFGLFLLPTLLCAQSKEEAASNKEKSVVDVALEELGLERERLQPDPIAIMASRTGASHAPARRDAAD